MINVPPLITNPAGNIAFTPHTGRYLPTRGPESYFLFQIFFNKN